MADKKISQFPKLNAISASTIIPVVHDGTTFKMDASSFAVYASQFSAKTGSSNIFSGNQTINGNLTLSGNEIIGGNLEVGGMITAQQYNVTYVSSSVQYQSGSTEFGDSPDDTHTFTGTLILNGLAIGTSQLMAQTASQNAINSGVSSVTGAFSVEFGSINSHIVTQATQTSSQDLVNRQISLVSGSLHFTTGALNAFTGSIIGQNNTISAFTSSVNFTTQSLNTQTGSQDLVNRGISSVTGSINTTTSSFDSVFLGISSVTGSLIGITNALMGFTASLDNTYATDAQLYELYQATASIHSATQSLNVQTGSQDSLNLTISNVTASLRAEIGGIESYTASLKAAPIISSSTQIQNYNLFALDASVAVKTSGSTLYSTNPSTNNFNQVNSIFLGSGAGQDATNAQSSIFLGVNAGIGATFAQESTFIGNSAGAYATNALRSNFLGINAGASAINAVNSNFIGYAAGEGSANASYSTIIGHLAGRKWFGNGVGTNNIIIGTGITLENDRRDSINFGGIIFATGSYGNTVGNPFSGSVGNGRVGINKVLPSFELDISGSVGVTGSLNVSSGITGSLYSTNGVVSSSNQIPELFPLMQATASLNTQTGSQGSVNLGISTFTGSLRSEVNLIEAYTASLKGAIEVSGQNVNVLGMITAQQFNVTYVSSSVLFQSGSTKSGNTPDDRHEFTGSALFSSSISTPSIYITNRVGSAVYENQSFNSTESSITNRIYSGFADVATNGGKIRLDFVGGDRNTSLIKIDVAGSWLASNSANRHFSMIFNTQPFTNNSGDTEFVTVPTSLLATNISTANVSASFQGGFKYRIDIANPLTDVGETARMWYKVEIIGSHYLSSSVII